MIVVHKVLHKSFDYIRQRLWLTALFVAFFSVTTVYASQRSASDALFLQLREAARTANAAQALALAAKLGEYPERAYVEYYRLRPQIYDAEGVVRLSTPDEAIRTFLTRWHGEAIADRLRNDWLLALGARRDRANFEQQYALFSLKDDPQVDCYALAFRAQDKVPVWREARAFLSYPRQLAGDGCTLLLNRLIDNQEIKPVDLWHLMLQAVDQNAFTAAQRLAELAGRAAPTGWEKVAKNSLGEVERDLKNYSLNTENERKLAMLGIVRWSRDDPLRSAHYLEDRAEKFTADERAFLWAQLGESAARRVMAEAHTYFSRADAAQPLFSHQDDVLPWQVRAALRASDWTMVRRAVEKMSDALRRDSTWTYWYARALQATGKNNAAEPLLRSIAGEFSFYGKLALEELGEPIALPPRASPTSADELAGAERNAGLQRALKFYALDMRFEGNREWNWQMRGMTDRQLLAAAEFARRKEIWDRAINAADRTRQEHDFSLRFVSPFKDLVVRQAHKLGLESSWVFGLVRQESRFIMNARSQVGASGLMQLMPATARQVAHQLGWRDYDPQRVNDIETNIALGTAYMRSRLDNLDGSYVLASAAYNAGIGRARQWRNTLTMPVEGAIFAETIPFAETRDYVKKVLSNAVYYAALFDNQSPSLKARLGVIHPK